MSRAVSRYRSLAWLAFVLLMLAMPFFVSHGLQRALIHAIIFAIFAAAFNLASGSGGLLSFGHSAFLAFGSFATLHVMRAIENSALAVPTALLPVVGALAGLLAGAIVGYFATLRSGVYFSMLTLAFAELFHQMAPNLEGVFGGETGLSSIRMPSWGISFATDAQVYYLVLAWAAICLGLLWFYMKTPFGRLTLAVRENEQRVRFLGFNVHASKVLIFSVSCAVAGVAGSLLALVNESSNYELFSLNYSANVLLYTFIGGSTLFFGAPLGAAILTLASYSFANTTKIWLFYQGIVFVLLMMYAPRGVGGIVARHVEAWREGRLRGAGGAYLFALIPAACLLGSVVFVCEALSVVLSREYAEKRAVAGGANLPAQFLGSTWDAQSLQTWSIPAVLAVLCWFTLPIAIRRLRAVWKES